MLLTDFLSTLRVMIIAGVNANFYFYIILAHFHGSSKKEDFSACQRKNQKKTKLQKSV